MTTFLPLSVMIVSVAIIVGYVWRIRNELRKEKARKDVLWRATFASDIRARTEQILHWTLLKNHPELPMPKIEVTQGKYFARLCWTSRSAYAEMGIAHGEIEYATYDRATEAIRQAVVDTTNGLPADFIGYLKENFSTEKH